MFHYFKKFWFSNLLYVFFAAVESGLTIISALLAAAEIDALIKFNFNDFLKWTLWDIATFAVLLVADYINGVERAKIMQKMDSALRLDIGEKLSRLRYDQYHAHQASDYSSWLSNDVNQIETQGFTNVYNMLDSILTAIFSMITLIALHWTLAIATLGFSALMIAVPLLVQKKMAQTSMAVTEKNAAFLQKVNDHLNGFDTLLALNHRERLVQAIKHGQQPLATAKVKQAKVQVIAGVLGNITNITAQSGIIFITGVLALRKIVPVGIIISTGNLAFRVFGTLASLASMIAMVRGTNVIFSKYNSLPVPPKQDGAALDAQLHSGLVLAHLTVAYDDHAPIIQDMQQQFKLGGKYAIVGPSGSGKSTLFNLLAGKLTNYSGSLTLNGQEYHDLNTTAIRDQVMYLDQIPYIFSGTVRDNLTLGDDYPDAALIDALKRADLWDQVQALPNSLDNSVGENGRTFSGGQRQRLALARGFLRHKQIILMDEGTASLDKDQALKIEETLLADPKLTVLMITHQLYPEIQKQLTAVVTVNYPHLRPKSLKWELATHAQWIGASLGTVEKL
ncbi:MAG: ABC transporter ATP-binding protein/permease [Schleiferilactobacillus harbinensis]|nr:ABC transporter ATP-binding protein/permease [Schleiferilactobacillus harbinensis]MCI1913302.1 ABC transporter ATP-binding protein/permease [Schleiferilactobacillus harbinensis]